MYFVDKHTVKVGINELTKKERGLLDTKLKSKRLVKWHNKLNSWHLDWNVKGLIEYTHDGQTSYQIYVDIVTSFNDPDGATVLLKDYDEDGKLRDLLKNMQAGGDSSDYAYELLTKKPDQVIVKDMFNLNHIMVDQVNRITDLAAKSIAFALRRLYIGDDYIKPSRRRRYEIDTSRGTVCGQHNLDSWSCDWNDGFDYNDDNIVLQAMQNVSYKYFDWLLAKTKRYYNLHFPDTDLTFEITKQNDTQFVLDTIIKDN